MAKDELLSRRKVLTAFSLASLAVISPLMAREKQEAQRSGQKTVKLCANIEAMKKDGALTSGCIVRTAGYYTIGDGGAAEYLILAQSTVERIGPEFISLDNGLVAVLVNVGAINYRMFGAKGDGVNDDGEQIKAAHMYANKMDIPVINLQGDFWIEKTDGIIIQTDVAWGKTKFHINERHNTSAPRFHITSKHTPISIELTEGEKQEFLEKFKPGVGVIPVMAAYKNCLVVVSDNKDRIGYRAGKAYGGKVSRMREELFYVEEYGRIIGDIAWAFSNYTTFIAYPADESYLSVEGGTFYVSGDDSGAKKMRYVMNGFRISRSRTIIRNQWVGLDTGKRDVSMMPRNGFYSFTNVYDCLLENVRLIPWEKDRGSKETSVSQGTYGLGGNRMFNVVFRNVTAEGSMVHWGVFGTNMNKNFRIERCKLNRVDVHFHCWNLQISDSEIGFKGISITGGGELIVTNTVCRDRRFINFRYDYGAKWDGSIYISNCRLAPDQSTDLSILSFMSANFDYRYPIGYAHMIKIEDFVVDYTAMPVKEVSCWVMRTAAHSSLRHGEGLFFPALAEFKNITVEGGGSGVRLMAIPNANGFKLKNEGVYDSTELISNAHLTFENIQLEVINSSGNKQDMHFIFESPTGKVGTHTLLPHIVFKNCRYFRGDFGGNIASILFEDCTVSEVRASDTKLLQGSIGFSNCKIKPVSSIANKPFSVASVLGTTFTNCLLLAPDINGQSRPDLLHLIDIVQLNKTVKYNHLNTRLGNDILKFCKNEGIVIAAAFIDMLKCHHELEAENVKMV
ncbi:hypothetical protein [Sphingobacterium haloxyli]|nr:hypothetical protein [Sphingobacterium haloxyli]